jgi:hypothetical protein
MYELMKERMSHKFCIFLKIHVSNVFSMHNMEYEMYILWMNKFCTISIIKSRNVKCVMWVFLRILSHVWNNEN